MCPPVRAYVQHILCDFGVPGAHIGAPLQKLSIHKLRTATYHA